MFIIFDLGTFWIVEYLFSPSVCCWLCSLSRSVTWDIALDATTVSRFLSPFRLTWGRQSRTWRSEAGPAGASTSPSIQTSPSQSPETVPAIRVGWFQITIIIIQLTSISLSVIRSCPYPALDICMSWLWDEERSNLQTHQKLVKKLRKNLLNKSPQTLLKDTLATEKKHFENGKDRTLIAR